PAAFMGLVLASALNMSAANGQQASEEAAIRNKLYAGYLSTAARALYNSGDPRAKKPLQPDPQALWKAAEAYYDELYGAKAAARDFRDVRPGSLRVRNCTYKIMMELYGPRWSEENLPRPGT